MCETSALLTVYGQPVNTVCRVIQEESALLWEILEEKKSSYEHGSDFERLRNYDRLKLGIEGNDY